MLMVGLHVEGSLSLGAWYPLGFRLAVERKTQDGNTGCCSGSLPAIVSSAGGWWGCPRASFTHLCRCPLGLPADPPIPTCDPSERVGLGTDGESHTPGWGGLLEC